MVESIEIAPSIYRVSIWDDPCLAGVSFPETSYNSFLIAGENPVLINTMFKRSFVALRTKIGEIIDPATLRYVVVPHHEGDSSGAINEWLEAAPRAEALCSELCAFLSLRDFATRAPRSVQEGEVVALGSHRLRFLLTPQVNQWDSLMVYEEHTGTLFSNDLFSMPGLEKAVTRDLSAECLGATREVGYQPDDRERLAETLDRIETLSLNAIAVMHGPVIKGHFKELISAFRANSLSHRRA